MIYVLRSAAFLLRYIILGLKEKLISCDEGAASLKLLYRCLKLATQDSDCVIRTHADSALLDLNAFMKSQLFIE